MSETQVIDPLLYVSPQTSRMERLVTFAGVVIPFLGLVTAIVVLWGWGFSWMELALLVGMYLATGLGITVGYHRLFTHRSFETFRPIKFILAVLGSMSMQGPLLRWVATHRRHHQHSDRADDPHSPHAHGGGFLGVATGWWYAHVGWMFRTERTDLARYVRDLYRDGLSRQVSRLFGLWVLLGLLIPAAVGGLVTRTWTGAALGFLWGGLVRIFLVHHVTWSINSVCHLWGRQPFSARDESRNNWLCGLLALGEGWHNNHHAFPTSARHGLRWWELDASYLVIRLMSALGLAWSVQIPSQDAQLNKRAAKPD